MLRAKAKRKYPATNPVYITFHAAPNSNTTVNIYNGGKGPSDSQTASKTNPIIGEKRNKLSKDLTDGTTDHIEKRSQQEGRHVDVHDRKEAVVRTPAWNVKQSSKPAFNGSQRVVVHDRKEAFVRTPAWNVKQSSKPAFNGSEPVDVHDRKEAIVRTPAWNVKQSSKPAFNGSEPESVEYDETDFTNSTFPCGFTTFVAPLLEDSSKSSSKYELRIGDDDSLERRREYDSGSNSPTQGSPGSSESSRLDEYSERDSDGNQSKLFTEINSIFNNLAAQDRLAVQNMMSIFVKSQMGKDVENEQSMQKELDNTSKIVGNRSEFDMRTSIGGSRMMSSREHEILVDENSFALDGPTSEQRTYTGAVKGLRDILDRNVDFRHPDNSQVLNVDGGNDVSKRQEDRDVEDSVELESDESGGGFQQAPTMNNFSPPADVSYQWPVSDKSGNGADGSVEKERLSETDSSRRANQLRCTESSGSSGYLTGNDETQMRTDYSVSFINKSGVDMRILKDNRDSQEKHTFNIEIPKKPLTRQEKVRVNETVNNLAATHPDITNPGLFAKRADEKILKPGLGVQIAGKTKHANLVGCCVLNVEVRIGDSAGAKKLLHDLFIALGFPQSSNALIVKRIYQGQDDFCNLDILIHTNLSRSVFMDDTFRRELFNWNETNSTNRHLTFCHSEQRLITLYLWEISRSLPSSAQKWQPFSGLLYGQIGSQWTEHSLDMLKTLFPEQIDACYLKFGKNNKTKFKEFRTPVCTST